jgi:amino acid transporter
MGLGVLQRGRRQLRTTEDEPRRLSVFDLTGLAAGGMIGSGWLLGAVDKSTMGVAAIWAWGIGGVLMLVLGAVMVELGTTAPKTGGLIFLPLQSSGALVATVVAAGLWIFYALNATSEAVAMTEALSSQVRALNDSQGLSGWGLACATVFLVVITVANLLAPRIFVKVNLALTAWKILIPVLVVTLLLTSGFHSAGLTSHHSDWVKVLGTAWPAVVGGSVLFAYLGFQGPLDFAGNVKQHGIGEAARLRRAVYGTIAGSIVLYLAVQIAFLGHLYQLPAKPDDPKAVADTAGLLGWAAPLFVLNAVLSPLGSGLVFAYALTREVAALSRAHLTHRGLQTAQSTYITVRGRRYETYWKILLVDFAIGWIALMAFHRSWRTLTAVISILALVVYAVPGVVLVALRSHLPACSRRRNILRGILARAAFLTVALVLYRANRWYLSYSMAALLGGTVLLLLLPLLARWNLPVIGRVLRAYDAKEHVTQFRQWRTDPAVAAVGLLLGYLALLTLLTFLDHSALFAGGKTWVGLVAVGLVAAVTFEGLVHLSRRHMAKNPPTLPAPATSPSASAAASVTAESG